jgi:GTP-binding protein Era
VTEPSWQALLTDTPGLVAVESGAEKYLHGRMRQAAGSSLAGADLALFLASHDVPMPEGLLKGLAFKPKCTALLVNKSDSGGERSVALLEKLKARLAPDAAFLISARKREGLEALKEWLARMLPEGEAQYGADEITLMTLRELAPEVIREKALLFMQDEVPHSLAVVLEDYRERENGLHAITATLFVERESQKGIVIGQGGAMLKKIGSAARLELEQLAGGKVFLQLWVKVRKDWKRDSGFLQDLGYHD